MFQLYDVNHNKISPINNYKDYHIEQAINTDDLLYFLYPISDTLYPLIAFECYIRDGNNEYVVKEINAQGEDWAEFVCKINLEDLKGHVVSNFETVNEEAENSANLALAGTGWTVGYCDVTKRRTVRKTQCSVYDVLKELSTAYACEITYNAVKKTINIHQKQGADRGVYFSEQLNLKQLDTQANSHGYVTRLIPIGKDGLDITSVNSGVNYVSNYQYSTKVITAYWVDNRYTVAQSLHDDAVERLAYLSKPIRAYSADIIDLANVSDDWDLLDFGLGDFITLLSESKGVREQQRIIKINRYPEEPERSTIEIANRIASLTDIISRVIDTSDTVDLTTDTTNALMATSVEGNLNNAYIPMQNVGELNATIASIGTLIATKAEITLLQAETARINNLYATSATVVNLEASNARIDVLEVNSATIDDLQVERARIGNLEVYSATVEQLNAVNAKITNLVVTNAMIVNLAVDNAKIANAAITTAKIADAQITNAKIDNLAVDNAKIADATITTAKIGIAQITTALIDDAAITNAKIANATILSANIADAQITTAKIALANITTALIADANITNAKIDRASINKLVVTTADIADANITNAKIGNLSVNTAKIADAAITTAKIGLAQITTALIGDAQITNAKIGNLAVDSAKIADAAITSAKIGDAQITTAKIADATITTAKIGDAQITTTKIGLAQITTALILDANITNAKIDRASVNKLVIVTADIADANITNAKIGNLAVTAAKIADATITSAKIANATIEGAKIANATIGTAQIATGAITTALIANAAIGTTQIADASITDGKIVGLTASKITAGTLDAGTINVTNLNAANITVGTINGNQISPGAIDVTKLGTALVTDINSKITQTDMASYVASRGENLITNGSGLLGDNTNFSAFTFDGSETYYTSGSFKKLGPGTVSTDEYMPVNPELTYRVSMFAKTLNGLGRYYAFMNCFDVDSLAITAQHHMYVANTLTTLTQPLNNGDTVVYLASAANWVNTGTAGVNTHLRSFILWNYVNSFGYKYPALTYSRNWIGNGWDPGAINLVDNTITLRVPWAGGTIPAGTQLSNGNSGGAYKYLAMINTLLTTSWANYTDKISGIDLSGTNANYKFPPGTAKTKIGWLMNYNSTGETVWITNLAFSVDYQGQIDTAQSTADNKNTVHYATTQPSLVGNSVDDIWFDTDDGNKIYKWTGSAWTATQFGTSAIANLAVTNALIADATIASAKISALDAGKITTGYLSAARIEALSIDASKLVANTITAGQIAASTITATQIAASTITVTQIAAATITGDRLVIDTITAREVAAHTITANEMVVGTITAASGIIANAAITTAQIASATITAANIANATITNLQIASATITAAQIANATITNAQIALATITAAQIANATITAAQIANATITNAQIANIDATKITTGYLAAARIAANTINTGHLIVANPNLISDVDSFEQYGGKEPPGNKGTLTTCIVTDEESYHGLYSLKTVSSAAGSYKYLNPTGSNNYGWVKLEAGKQYLISVYIKTTSATAIGAQLVFVTTEGKTATAVAGTVTATGSISLSSGWTRISALSPVIGGTNPYATFYVRNVASGTTIYWDAIQIEECETGNTDPSHFGTGGAVILDGGNIIADTVTANQIAVGTITAASGIIANAAITTANIANAAITTALIGVGQITTALIADASITNALIDRASVNKLVVTSADIANATITTADIGAAQITTALIANAAITNAQIALATITAANIANATITSAQIANATITNANIASLDAAKITTGFIDAARIQADTIDANHLTSTAIDGMVITGATIQTAATGNRLVLNSNYLRGYDSLGERIRIDNNRITFDGNGVIPVNIRTYNDDELTVEGYDSLFEILSVGKGAIRLKNGFHRATLTDQGFFTTAFGGTSLVGKIVVPDTVRSAGMYGNYVITKIAHIWSIGADYAIPDTGANFGNLYGLAYKHINNLTGGTMAGGHQAVWCQNGIPKVALGNDIWTSGDLLVTALSNIKINGTAIISSGINYIRFADGTQIVWGSVSHLPPGAANVRGTFLLPVAFKDGGYIVSLTTSNTDQAGQNSNRFMVADFFGRITDRFQYKAYISTDAHIGMEVHYIATGKWK